MNLPIRADLAEDWISCLAGPARSTALKVDAQEAHVAPSQSRADGPEEMTAKAIILSWIITIVASTKASARAALFSMAVGIAPLFAVPTIRSSIAVKTTVWHSERR